MESYFCCPHCGNKDVQATTETNTTTTGSNFSAGKGCLGYLLFGPLGILCGSCGNNQQTVTTNTTHWHCSNCGKKFRNPDEIIKENENLIRSSEITFGILGTIFTVVMLFVFREEIMLGLLFALVCCATFGACCYGMIRSCKNKIEAAYEQQKAMKKFMKEKAQTEAVQNVNVPVSTYEPAVTSAESSVPSVNQNPVYNPAEIPAQMNVVGAVMEKDTATEKTTSKAPVRVYPNAEGFIFCPMCGTMQKADRKICFRCEVPFISENKTPSYRCGICGYNEDYGEFCPNCGSNSKILNIQK